MFFGFNAFDPRHSPAVSEKQESYASSFTASALGCVPLACEFPQHPSARCRWGVLRSTVEWTARSCEGLLLVTTGTASSMDMSSEGKMHSADFFPFIELIVFIFSLLFLFFILYLCVLMFSFPLFFQWAATITCPPGGGWSLVPRGYCLQCSR